MILKFIEQQRSKGNAEHFFTCGGCYLFYRVLKSYYPSAEPYYDMDHIITKIDGKYYDITGEVPYNGHFKLHIEQPSLEFFDCLKDKQQE